LAGALDLIEDGATLKLLAGPSSSSVWFGVAWLVWLKWRLLVIVLLAVLVRLVTYQWRLWVAYLNPPVGRGEPWQYRSLAMIVGVHGTFAAEQEDAGPRWWQEGASAVRLWFDETLRGRVVWDRAFHWSGKNKESDRLKAAKALLARLNTLRGWGGVHLIGHSHGGLVVWRALCLGKRRRMDLSHVKSWATVGTPFLHFAFDLASLNVVVVAIATTVGADFAVRAFSTLLPYGTALAMSGSYLFEAAALATLGAGALAYFSLIGLGKTLYAAWSSWRDSVAQVEAWKEHGAKWLGLWSDDDEAIRGLRRSRELEGDWRAFLPLPAGADTLANELVWGTLRHFLQGNDLLARELVDVTTGPIGDTTANSLTPQAASGLLEIAEAQGRNMSSVLRSSFADATATNTSQRLHVLIARLSEADLTRLLVHCAYFPTSEKMNVLGPREVITALYDQIRNRNQAPAPASAKYPRAFVGPLAWRPALAVVAAAAILALVTSFASRFVAGPYTTDAVVRDILEITPAARPEDFARSPDVIRAWLRARIAHGADPSTMGPMLADRDSLETIAEALTTGGVVGSVRLARVAEALGVDRTGLHYFVGRSLAAQGRLGEAARLADSLPKADAADLMLGVVGELDGRSDPRHLEALERSATRVLPTEPEAAAKRYLDDRAKGRVALAILASVRGRADAGRLEKQAREAISQYFATFSPPSIMLNSYTTIPITEGFVPRDGHMFRAWGRHHLLAGRYPQAWEEFWHAGTDDGRWSECANVVVEASRHGRQPWAMKQAEKLDRTAQVEALTRVAMDLDKAGYREEGAKLASDAAELWAARPDVLIVDKAPEHPVIPWTYLRDLLILLGRSLSPKNQKEDGLDALHNIFFHFAPEERAKAVALATEEIVRVERERIAAFLERLKSWGDPSIAAAYGVVARRERAGEGEPIVEDTFGLRKKLGGGAAGMEAPAWMAAKLLLENVPREGPPAPGPPSRPWRRSRTSSRIPRRTTNASRGDSCWNISSFSSSSRPMPASGLPPAGP
jgi:hypothetical protein